MSRRHVRLIALGLVPPLLLAVVAVCMHAAGLTGVDSAAHAYKIDQLRHGLGAVFWDSFWYGGTYGVIGYGPLYYLCALAVPGSVLVVLAAGSLPLTFHLYLRKVFGAGSLLSPAALTLVLCVYLVNGQDPFLFGLAFMMGGLVLLAHGRSGLAALAAGAALFSNPLAFLVGAVFLLADFFARPGSRRQCLFFLAWLAPFLVARVLLSLLFAERAAYFDDLAQVARPLVFALAGAALAWLAGGERRRQFVTLFMTYAVICVATLAATPLPLGNNVNRLFMVFGVPLLLAVGLPRLSEIRRLPVLRRLPAAPRSPLVPVVFALVVAVAAWQQLATPAGHLFAPPRPQAADAAFFAPALQWAAAHVDDQHRVHVVALAKHWEAYYFPRAGYAITRGWYRQEDAVHNALFLPPSYGPADYEKWLQSMGVRYVFVPHAPLDFSSAGEPAILAGSPAFFVAAQLSHWTVYELRRPGALFAPAPGTAAGARVLSFDHRALRLQVGAPGAYILRVTWSPYWQLQTCPGNVTKAAGDWLLLHARAAGVYELRFRVSLSGMGRAL